MVMEAPVYAARAVGPGFDGGGVVGSCTRFWSLHLSVSQHLASQPSTVAPGRAPASVDDALAHTACDWEQPALKENDKKRVFKTTITNIDYSYMTMCAHYVSLSIYYVWMQLVMIRLQDDLMTLILMSQILKCNIWRWFEYPKEKQCVPTDDHKILLCTKYVKPVASKLLFI